MAMLAAIFLLIKLRFNPLKVVDRKLSLYLPLTVSMQL